MEEENGGSAMAKVTLNPSSFDVDKRLEELLPNPGPIPKRLESVPEEPCVEKDISREGRPPASELQWGKKKSRSVKGDEFQAAQILLSLKCGKPEHNMEPVEFLFEKLLTMSDDRNIRMILSKWGKKKRRSVKGDEFQAAQILLSLKCGKPEHNMEPVEFLFEKLLTMSDDCNNRMILSKEDADKYLSHVRPQIGTKKMIVMQDFDTGQSWEFSYRLWIYKNRIMHALQKMGAFMKAHNLQEGDLVCFYKTSEGNFVIQGKIGHKGCLVCSGSERPHVAT